MSQEKQRIGLAMSVYNHVDLTRNCLESLFSDPDRPPYFLSIVNNGSEDATQEYLEKFAAEINSGNRGDLVKVQRNQQNQALARAWNQALRGLDTEWRVVVSNDILVPANWWEHLRTGMETHRLDLAAPYILEGSQPENLTDWVADFRRRNDGRMWNEYSFVMFALRASLLEEVGYLDENFLVGGLEDTDYIWRLREKGKRYGIVGSTAIFHFVSRTMNEIRDRDGNGHFATNLKYFYEKWQRDPREVENSLPEKLSRRWRRWKMRFGYM